jgi:ABC-2 type transport system permease protein
MSIFRKIYNWLSDAAYVWRFEISQVIRDEGVLLFCLVPTS